METAGFHTRFNIMTINNIQTFASIRGGMNGDCKDVYFIRGVGCGPNYLAEIEAMDRKLWDRERSGRGGYCRAAELPRLADPDAIAEYQGIVERWEDSGRKELLLKACADQPLLADALARALIKVQETFAAHTANVSSSMEKNFMVKLLFWLERAAGGLFEKWTGRDSHKFVLSGRIKKQEYLFGYLLTLLGIDVLLLLPTGEAEVDPGLQKLSAVMTLGPGATVTIPSYVPEKYRAECETAVNRQGSHGTQETGGMHGSRGAQKTGGMHGSRGAQKTGGMHGSRETQKTGGISETGSPQSAGAQGVEAAHTRPKVDIRRPDRETKRTSPSSQPNPPSARPVVIPARPGRSTAAQPMQRREMEFEELALLASSVVMITVHDQKGEVLGTGSGIMIGSKGFILTNNHVAAGGRFYSVRIEDDEKIYQTDEVIKYHSVQDLAVIRIGRSLKPIPLYQGQTPLARGQKVVAIGSPLGLFNSVSNGIISGFRQINNVDMIQFTAPISHGSSGGALLNMYGEVIGISTAGFDGGQNINLAVEYRCINNFVRGFV